MELPLFPLNAVLFPGTAMPLHIFEERYRAMIGRCLEDKAPFGVLLIRSGSEVGGPAEPFAVGTTAYIVRVQHLPDGRMNIVCRGGERFRLLKVLRQDPYLVGEVETIASTSKDDPEIRDLADAAAALFGEQYRLHLALSNQWARSLNLPQDPDDLADFIGARLAVSPWTKQRLLEELDLRRRLEMEIDILGEAIREMTVRLKAAQVIRWQGLGAMN